MTQKTNKHQKKPAVHPIKWGNWFKKISITLLFVAVVGATFAFNSKISEAKQDISVIGNGMPTVVQIFDSHCQLCRRLKSNLDSVKGDFKQSIQFKTVNIKTAKGRAFASQHNVPHVTLLLFDKKGARLSVLEGVTPAEDIRAALVALERRR